MNWGNKTIELIKRTDIPKEELLGFYLIGFTSFICNKFTEGFIDLSSMSNYERLKFIIELMDKNNWDKDVKEEILGLFKFLIDNFIYDTE
jgi:hypothetical protein